VRLETANYPSGTDFTLQSDPGQAERVYERVRNSGALWLRGESLVEAKLHFQACDKNICLPPKDDSGGD